jgi:hypothetical protein
MEWPVTTHQPASQYCVNQLSHKHPHPVVGTLQSATSIMPTCSGCEVRKRRDKRVPSGMRTMTVIAPPVPAAGSSGNARSLAASSVASRSASSRAARAAASAAAEAAASAAAASRAARSAASAFALSAASDSSNAWSCSHRSDRDSRRLGSAGDALAETPAATPLPTPTADLRAQPTKQPSKGECVS